MMFLRGFAQTLEDVYFGEENIIKIADMVFGFEEKIIMQLKGYGFDAVGFFDDWGMQNNLIISPQLWRSFFKPRYKRQFDLTHENGLFTYYHSCGYVHDIIDDFIEIGMDIFNMSQPNVYDVREIGAKFAGKTCFACPISYQTTAISGTKQDIYKEAKRLLESFWIPSGGFIAYIEEYESIGLKNENFKHGVRAFKELGKIINR